MSLTLLYNRDKYFKKHALMLKRKMKSKNNRYNVQSEEMVEREFVIIKNDEVADASDDLLHATNFREPLLEDAGVL